MKTIILLILTANPQFCKTRWVYDLEQRSMTCLGDEIFKGGFDAKD